MQKFVMTMGEYAHFFCAYSPVIVHYLHFRVRAAEGVGPYMGCCLEADNLYFAAAALIPLYRRSFQGGK